MNIKILGILLLFVLFSCRKNVADNDPQFIGRWVCRGNTDWGYIIEINKNGNAKYSEVLHGHYYQCFEGVARNDNKKLTIKGMYGFKIILYPEKIDTNIEKTIYEDFYSFPDGELAGWKMELEGPSLYEGSGIYYKSSKN